MAKTGDFSMAIHIPGGSQAHSLSLFQESLAGPPRFLDLKLCFNDLAAFTYEYEPGLEDVAAGGRRWWSAFNKRDPRTMGHGMVPGVEPPEHSG